MDPGPNRTYGLPLETDSYYFYDYEDLIKSPTGPVQRPELFHKTIMEMVDLACKKKKYIVGGDHTFIYLLIRGPMPENVRQKKGDEAFRFAIERVKRQFNLWEPNLSPLRVNEIYEEYSDNTWLDKLGIKKQVMNGEIGITYSIEMSVLLRNLMKLFDSKNVRVKFDPATVRETGNVTLIAQNGQKSTSSYAKTVIEMVANGYSLHYSLHKWFMIAHSVNNLFQAQGGADGKPAPEGPEALLDRAGQYIGLQGLEQGLDYVDKALKLDEKNKYGWFLKGKALALMGSHVEAMDCYRKALSLDKGYALAWAGLGTLLVNEERYNEALDCLDKALKKDNSLFDGWKYMGIANYCLGRYEDAVAALLIAMKLRESDTEVWLTMGNTLEYQKETDKAFDCYMKVIQLDPGISEAWWRAGVMLGMDGEYEKALEAFDRALGMTPNDPAIWHEKGKMFEAMGRVKDAKACFDRALFLQEGVRRPPNY